MFTSLSHLYVGTAMSLHHISSLGLMQMGLRPKHQTLNTPLWKDC